MISPTILQHPRFPVVVLAVAALAIAGMLSLLDPFGASSVLPPCFFHTLTHLYCPGCGTTRALHALLHGQLALAVQMNPLTVIVLPLIPLMLWNTMCPERTWFARVSDARLWLPLVVAFAVLRNLPWEPFIWLAPG